MFDRGREVRDALREANYALRPKGAPGFTAESVLFALLLATIAATLYLSRF